MSIHKTSPSRPGENLSRIVAKRSSLSRRKAGQAIKDGRVLLNGEKARIGDRYHKGDALALDGTALHQQEITTIVLNKPIGYECSRDPQGDNPSIYQLIPTQYQSLHHVGRLDVDSSGLLVLTNDGTLTHELTHPRYEKEKVYEVSINKPLAPDARKAINQGVMLDDGVSNMNITGSGVDWTVTMSEGRNRQIRRTFKDLGYEVKKLHRIKFGSYKLGTLKSGHVQVQ